MKVLWDILRRFPAEEMVASFAYGSGVFAQRGHNTSGKVLDFMLVVDDCEPWHRKNLERNRSDYSSLASIGYQRIAQYQRRFGAHVFCNTLVNDRETNCVFKYSLIERSALITDLLDWNHLYTAGRLHKPVLWLHEATDDKQLRDSLDINIRSALHVALLMLPEVFTAQELFNKIAGLSYHGDFRMLIGEDTKKVESIVGAQMEHFHQLYRPVYEKDTNLAWSSAQNRFEQAANSVARRHRLHLIPHSLLSQLVGRFNHDGRMRDAEEVIFTLSYQPADCSHLISDSLASVVRATSWSQTLKNVPSAGFTKSVRYGWSKLGKRLKSLSYLKAVS